MSSSPNPRSDLFAVHTNITPDVDCVTGIALTVVSIQILLVCPCDCPERL